VMGGDHSMSTPSGSSFSWGQQPRFCNEVAPLVDCLIGTERRTQVGCRALPRTPSPQNVP
jgi:hypothetical protein